MKSILRFTFFIIVLIISAQVSAQNYQLVWEDNFDGITLDSSKWNIEQKIGIWNTGANSEFQHYRKENVSVGDDGDGNNCLILTAKKEDYNNYHYTSGKVTTKGKVTFRRGKLEASIKIPDLANGLWPAFWTLGYTPIGWPDCGEIDILEMGHSSAIDADTQNSYIGAHLFWGPYPRDWGLSYTANEDLSTGFYKHTVIWNEEKISVFFNNAPTPYFSMGIDGNDTEEFHNFQDYIIFNLALGGSLPGIYNQNGITAPLPANMYIDWVKLYQLDDEVDFNDSNLPLYNLFGVFEEEAPVDMRMDLGFDIFENTLGVSTIESNLNASVINLNYSVFENYSGPMTITDITPKAGKKMLAYRVEADQDFEIKLSSGLVRNMKNYVNGSLQCYISTTAQNEIQIGIADTLGNASFMNFSDESGVNIIRDGNWQLATLPLSEISDQVNIAALKDMLIVKGNFSSSSDLFIDEVIFSETEPVSGIFGIYTNNPTITDKFHIDNTSGFLYNWSNTIVFNENIPAYEGEEVLSFKSSGAATWWGFGLFSSNPLNIVNFADGYLNFALQTTATQTFSINMNGANDTQGSIEFINENDPYSFERDGKWHQLSIPITDLTSQGLDLSACGNIFTMSGSSIGDIAIDDIYLSETEGSINNTAICYPVSIEISPKSSIIKQNQTKKFTAKVLNQFENPTDGDIEWFSNGGTINETGTFTSVNEGTFYVWATLGNLSDSTTITVEKKTGLVDLENKVEIRYNSNTSELIINGIEKINYVMLVNLSGEIIYQSKLKTKLHTIDMKSLPCSIYITKIYTGKQIHTRKFVNQ